MTILQVTTTLTGFAGAPGYQNFYFIGGGDQERVDSARQVAGTFWSGMADLLPQVSRYEVSQECVLIDEMSGMVEGYALGSDEDFSGGGRSTGGYSGPVGAVVNWFTDGVRNGRRVRGRTFVVPASTSNFDSDGSLTSDTLTDARGAASRTVAAGQAIELAIWSRPRGGSPGQAYAITGATVPDFSAVLRSRRD